MIHQADKLQAKSDRVTFQELGTAVNHLKEAIRLYELGETLGTLDDPTRQKIIKLRKKVRNIIEYLAREG